MKGKDILDQVIRKGGLYGRAAEMYIHDENKTDQFIKECSEQCHNRSAQEHWGLDLVSEIKKYTESKNKNANQNYLS